MTLQETHERYALLMLLRAVKNCPLILLPPEVLKAAEMASEAVRISENEYDEPTGAAV